MRERKMKAWESSHFLGNKLLTGTEGNELTGRKEGDNNKCLGMKQDQLGEMVHAEGMPAAWTLPHHPSPGPGCRGNSII